MADFAEAWHLFEIRRAVLTSNWLTIAPPAINFSIRIDFIHKATASLLYMNLVSLLDEAMATQMSTADYDRCAKVHNRLGFLGARGKMLDANELLRINARRNEIGHQLDKDVTVKDLQDDTQKIAAQLEAWGLIVRGPAYDLAFERSAVRAPIEPDPKIAFQHDNILRVMRGDKWVFEAKSTSSTYRLGS